MVDDIFQDFFLSLASTSLPDNIRNMKRYLYKAITNDVVSMARRVRYRRERMKVYALDYRTRIWDDKPDGRMVSREEKEQVFDVLKKHLRPSEFQAVMWRYWRDRGNDEAAQELGIKKRSFIRYLCSGMKKIRKLNLSQEGF